jgi:hypothetical protein
MLEDRLRRGSAEDVEDHLAVEEVERGRLVPA